jgi:hypothetical protein
MKKIILTVRKLIARFNVLSFRFCIYFVAVDMLVVYVLDFVCQVLVVVCIVFLITIMKFIVFFLCPYFFFHYKCFYANLMKLKWTKVFFNKQVDEILFLKVLVITNHVAKSQGLIIIHIANNHIKVKFKLNIHGILLVTLSSILYCDSIEIVG